MNTRYLAARALTPLLQGKGSLAQSLTAQLNACPERSRSLLQQTCYGTSRYYPQLQLIAQQLLKKPFQFKDFDLQALLLVALYQLRHLDSAPDHAVINETVEAVKLLDKHWASKLINAVLRNYLRQREQLEQALSKQISYQLNHPEWFIHKATANWGEQQATQLCQQNDGHPPFCLRVNTAKVSRETYIEKLADIGLEATATDFSSFGVRLVEATAVDKLPGFAEGWVSVQDEAAQLSQQLLEAKPGDRLLDACSAPGGKLCHLLEQHASDCEIHAIELEPKRAVRIGENLSRLGYNCPVTIGDVTEQQWWDGKLYQRILLDAPCSATGVIRRNPDIKLMRQPEQIHQLAKIQQQALENLWQMLAPGGRLVYATCSIFPQENERQIARFVKLHSDAIHLPIEVDWGEQQAFGRQIMPSDQGPDGFYYAVLEKAQ